MADKQTQNITVSIRTREKLIFEGVASSVTSFNVRGKFDILPFHTNFITLVSKFIIIDAGTQNEQKYDIDKGIMYVMANRVSVYVGI